MITTKSSDPCPNPNLFNNTFRYWTEIGRAIIFFLTKQVRITMVYCSVYDKSWSTLLCLSVFLFAIFSVNCSVFFYYFYTQQALIIFCYISLPAFEFQTLRLTLCNWADRRSFQIADLRTLIVNFMVVVLPECLRGWFSLAATTIKQGRLCISLFLSISFFPLLLPTAAFLKMVVLLFSHCISNMKVYYPEPEWEVPFKGFLFAHPFYNYFCQLLQVAETIVATYFSLH